MIKQIEIIFQSQKKLFELKKNKILLAAGVVLLSMSVSCKKYPKPDIVKYTVNGKSYEVTGAYSDLDFKGIGKRIEINYIGFSAHNENRLSFGSGSEIELNKRINFVKQIPNQVLPNLWITINKSSPNRKTFSTINNNRASFTITKNESSYIEGNFSGWLYYMGMFGDEPISDSVEITNGYFYLTK